MLKTILGRRIFKKTVEAIIHVKVLSCFGIQLMFFAMIKAACKINLNQDNRKLCSPPRWTCMFGWGQWNYYRAESHTFPQILFKSLAMEMITLLFAYPLTWMISNENPHGRSPLTLCGTITKTRLRIKWSSNGCPKKSFRIKELKAISNIFKTLWKD